MISEVGLSFQDHTRSGQICGWIWQPQNHGQWQYLFIYLFIYQHQPIHQSSLNLNSIWTDQTKMVGKMIKYMKTHIWVGVFFFFFFSFKISNQTPLWDLRDILSCIGTECLNWANCFMSWDWVIQPLQLPYRLASWWWLHIKRHFYSQPAWIDDMDLNHP